MDHEIVIVIVINGKYRTPRVLARRVGPVGTPLRFWSTAFQPRFRHPVPFWLVGCRVPGPGQAPEFETLRHVRAPLASAAGERAIRINGVPE
jgi:hypothetical protein